MNRNQSSDEQGMKHRTSIFHLQEYKDEDSLYTLEEHCRNWYKVVH